MELFGEEASLMQRLQQDIRESDKERIVFIAGHFPVNYETGRAYEDLVQWGCFSAYTLQLATRLAGTATGDSRRVGFALIADDLFNERTALTQYGNGQLSRWRGALYREHSGNSKVHPTFQMILETAGFGTDDLIRQDQLKNARRDCLYVSEKFLRAERDHVRNECAKAYLGFLDTSGLFDKDKDHLVAFIPTKCRDGICNIALPEVDDLSSSHVFMPSARGIVPSDLWGTQRIIYQN